ncbi:MAG: DNA topoisomerase, partial [bacterium]|nr:DNA topoisomerase [bacterium]
EEEVRLYELIRARTLASQMADAIMTRTKIVAECEGIPEFSATGSTIAFDGWLVADPAAKGENVILPEATAGEALTLEKIASEQKFTEPPPRYTEAGLVKELEKRGIGRPSTYASIIKTIVDRGYVVKEGRALQITSTGDVVSTFLENNFEKYISDSFTAEMEDELDQIASGERKYAETLHDFYIPFSKDVKSKENIEKLTNLGDAPKEFPCPICEATMVMKLGKTGVFMSCSRFPECKGSRTETGDALKDNEPIGKHPETGNQIFVKTGRFGPYVEMPETINGEKKTKGRSKKPAARRASIPKEINPAEITMEQATKLLSIPRELGAHPETGEAITAAIGKFGPFVVHQGDFRSLKGGDNPYDITHERALEIFKEPKKIRPGAPTVVRTIGPHPRTKKPILLYKSKSGFFLKKGFKRVSVQEKDAETLTVSDAIQALKSSF